METDLRRWMRLMESWRPFIREFRHWLDHFNQAAGPVYVDIIGSGTTATIESVTSENKNQGHASKVMAMLCELADKNGMTLTLQPVSYADYGEAEGGLGMDDLIMWYEKFGFELDTNTGWMTR
jgi:hypothetical protein